MSEKDLNSIGKNDDIFKELFAGIFDKEGNTIVNSELPKKQNPHTIIQEKENKPSAYKSVRLFSDDYEVFRKYAFENKMTILDVIQMSRKLLEKYASLK